MARQDSYGSLLPSPVGQFQGGRSWPFRALWVRSLRPRRAGEASAEVASAFWVRTQAAGTRLSLEPQAWGGPGRQVRHRSPSCPHSLWLPTPRGRACWEGWVAVASVDVLLGFQNDPGWRGTGGEAGRPRPLVNMHSHLLRTAALTRHSSQCRETSGRFRGVVRKGERWWMRGQEGSPGDLGLGGRVGGSGWEEAGLPGVGPGGSRRGSGLRQDGAHRQEGAFLRKELSLWVVPAAQLDGICLGRCRAREGHVCRS